MQNMDSLKGDPDQLNSNLGMDEQAELLPYDHKFEFPWDRIVSGMFIIYCQSDILCIA